jgi:hypothetical protein
VISLPALPPAWGVAATLAVVAFAYRVPRAARGRSAAQSEADLPTGRFARRSSASNLFRIGAGAVPFLLPLMLQLGFGMTPFQSGMVTFVSAGGAIVMKFTVKRDPEAAGFPHGAHRRGRGRRSRWRSTGSSRRRHRSR